MVNAKSIWTATLRRGFLLVTLLASSANVLAKQPARADLTLKDLDGKRVHLHDLRGKIIVLNFWATWCGPCNEEMPLLVQAKKEYGSRGILFLGASLDDESTRGKIQGFIHSKGIDFPIWIGAGPDDLDRLDMGPAVPATAFIDTDGYIVARVSGEIRPEELKERLDWLVQGRVGPAPKARLVHLDEH